MNLSRLKAGFERVCAVGVAGGQEATGKASSHELDPLTPKLRRKEQWSGIKSDIEEQKKREQMSAILEEQARIEKLKAKGFTGVDHWA